MSWIKNQIALYEDFQRFSDALSDYSDYLSSNCRDISRSPGLYMDDCYGYLDKVSFPEYGDIIQAEQINQLMSARMIFVAYELSDDNEDYYQRITCYSDYWLSSRDRITLTRDTFLVPSSIIEILTNNFNNLSLTAWMGASKKPSDFLR